MEIEIKTNFGAPLKFCGDLYFRMVNAKNQQLICRFALNTSFMDPNQNLYSLTKLGVDPDSIAKNSKVDPDFAIRVLYSSACEKCKPQFGVDMLCASCQKNMENEI